MRLAPVLLVGALALTGCGKSVKPSADAPDTAAAPEAVIEPTAAMGEQVFKRCVACHTIDKGGANGIGPNLHGIVGRAVASHEGFNYSSAMKAHGGVWDDAALDAYLTSPAKAIPGNRMTFFGIADPADRKALILYLDAQK